MFSTNIPTPPLSTTARDQLPRASVLRGDDYCRPDSAGWAGSAGTPPPHPFQPIPSHATAREFASVAPTLDSHSVGTLSHLRVGGGLLPLNAKCSRNWGRSSYSHRVSFLA